MNDWLIIAVVYFALFISSPLIALLHELGHAFAYLILTKPDEIDIYIGSYTQPTNGLQFKAGKINFYIKRSFPFVKGIGLCKSSKPETNYSNYIIILFSGALFTFFAAIILGVIVYNANANLLVQIGCYIFLGLSVASLMVNLIPREVDKFNNKLTLNSDGKQIAFVLKIKNALPDYIEARQFYFQKDFEQAIAKLKDVLKVVPDEEQILRMLFTASVQLKECDDAELYVSLLEEKGKLTADDLVNKACLQSSVNKSDDAILTYQKALKLNKTHVIALNNVGYELIEKGAHQVAQRALDKAIKLNPKFDHAYGNLGYSKILQDDLDVGKGLIDKCLQLNANNAEAFRALGIYYLKKKDIDQANANFNKATEIDKDIDVSKYTNEIKLLAEAKNAILGSAVSDAL